MKPTGVVLLSKEMETNCFEEADLNRIAAVTDLRRAESDTINEETQAARMTGANVIITGWGSRPITPAMLERAPDLRLMCHSAGSVKSFVCGAFLERGIRVSSSAAALAVGVAEFTFGLMLVSMKAAWQYHAQTLTGGWNREKLLDWVCEPHGATVGVIGASHVGRAFIRLCKNVSLKTILLYDPYVNDAEASAMGVERVELDDLMGRADVVSLHAPAIEQTRHMINARNLALMKDRAIFINTARGMCVDEPALIAELQKGRLFACIDVTDPEPPKPGSPLYSLPNCILTPHIAGAVKQNMRRQGALVADEVESFVAHSVLRHEVDLTRLDRIA